MSSSAIKHAGRAFVTVGAGTLGRRIAMMWLTRGGQVNLYDKNQKQLDDATRYIETNLPETIRKLVPGGKPGRLRCFTDMPQALDNAWMVTEAVPEIKDVKVKLLGELDAATPEDVIIATNSSSYMAREIWDNVKHRQRLLNAHYYMPPGDIALEIMPTSETRKDIAPLLMQLSKDHGLIPFLARQESVGLIANRIWAAVKREALLVVHEGVATPQEVDELWSKIPFASKPFRAMDSVGLDVALDIERHYLEVREDVTRRDAADLLERYVKEGTLGRKTGKGFYDYAGEK